MGCWTGWGGERGSLIQDVESFSPSSSGVWTFWFSLLRISFFSLFKINYYHYWCCSFTLSEWIWNYSAVHPTCIQICKSHLHVRCFCFDRVLFHRWTLPRWNLQKNTGKYKVCSILVETVAFTATKINTELNKYHMHHKIVSTICKFPYKWIPMENHWIPPLANIFGY